MIGKQGYRTLKVMPTDIAFVTVSPANLVETFTVHERRGYNTSRRQHKTSIKIREASMAHIALY
jgi:hypothetical protein